MRKLDKGWKNLFKFLAVILIIGSIYFVGYTVGHRNLILEKGYIPKVTNTKLGAPSDVDFSIFWDAWNIINTKYIGEINPQEMVYGAISGMAASLKDPYSLFLNPAEAKRFTEDLKGSFEGIGAELEAKSGNLIIVAPLEGSPAEKAGLKAQDGVVKIDGQDVSGMSFQDAINKIRGKKGTIVVLTVARQGLTETKEIKITREIINVASVKWEEKDGYTYIKIRQFGEDTVDLMKKAADFANKQSDKGIILDLRNNPGGYLDSSVDIASLFLDDKVVVMEKEKDGEEKKIKTTLTPKLKDKKLVVLVNGGSASASEILAGAIQDYARGLIIGEKTYGKGSVQNLEGLKDGSELRVTIAKWLTPNGRAIDKEGIKPDIEIKLTDENIKANQDPQLERAVQELNK